VLTNAVGAVSEFIDDGQNGFVAATEAEYLLKLKSLAADPDLRKRLGQAARQQVFQKFNWEAVIKEYLKIYESLVH
ncbi:glycosyltransferase family 1 protein, partial [Candidatus Parcubacteria bacterium]